MIDADNPLEVMDALGQSVVSALGRVVRDARTDLQKYRAAFPEWSARSTNRGTKSWIHDRLFDHVQREFDHLANVKLKVTEPAREFMVHGRFRFRMKAHQPGDLLSTYPTSGALQFMRQGRQLAFPAMDEIRLVAGYRWDPDLMEMNEAVVSLRNGRRCIWAVELREEPGSVVSQFSPYPVAPVPDISIKLPGLDEASDG